MKHRHLHRLPASEWIAAARGHEFDAILDCHRCACGGWWLWIADREGFTTEYHAALNEIEKE